MKKIDKLLNNIDEDKYLDNEKPLSENTINLWKQFRTDIGFYPKWFRRVQWGFKSNTFS